MARPNKDGADYFPFDVSFFDDRKVRLIKNKLGFASISVIIAFYSKVYCDKGYYMHWSDDDCVIVADFIGGGCNADFVTEVLEDCISRDIFDAELFRKFKILTSRGIQARYFRIFERRNVIYFFNEFSLMSEQDFEKITPHVTNKIKFVDYSVKPINVDINSVNVDINGINVDINSVNADIYSQSKVNKKKNKVYVNAAAGGISQQQHVHTCQNDDNIKKILCILPKKTSSSVSASIAAKLADWLGVFPLEVINLAITESLNNNAYHYNYISNVLLNWKNKKLFTVNDVHKHLENWAINKRNAPNVKKSKFASSYKGRDWDYDELEKLIHQKHFSEEEIV